MKPADARRDLMVAAAVFVVFFALFWLGRSHSFGAGDSPEHALAALLWAVPHPPGYPLQTALGWLWTRLPWMDQAAAINGLSGLFAAAAAALLFMLLRSTGARRGAALLGAAMMALAPLFWYYSLVAEVRALNSLLALAAAVCAFSWSRSGSVRALLVFSLLFGLGMSHHPTFVFLVPAYAAWLSKRRPSATLTGTALALAALGLVAPYLILGLRLRFSDPAYSYFEVRGWGGLWALYSRKHFGGPLRMADGAPLLGLSRFDFGRLAEHFRWLLSSLWAHGGPVALALAALGAASLWKTSRRDFAAWTLWFGATAGVFLVFSSQQMPVIELEYARAVAARFHLLPLIAVFALAGFGAEALARRIPSSAFHVLLAAALVAPLVMRPLSLARQNPLLDYTRALVRDSAPGDFIILGGDDTIFAALNLDLIHGEGRDRVFLSPTMFAYPPYLRRLKATHPGIVLPPLGPKGLSTDWALWKKLNPGRAVLAEPSLRDVILFHFPKSVPQGVVIRVESSSVKFDPAADARRFLDAPETSSFTRRQSRTWTQEVYLLQARMRMADWLASRLDPRVDEEVRGRLNELMDQL